MSDSGGCGAGSAGLILKELGVHCQNPVNKSLDDERFISAGNGVLEAEALDSLAVG